MKKNLRRIIYANHALKTFWTKLIKFKDINRFRHRKIINKFYYFYLIKVKGYKEVIFNRKIVNGMFKVFINKKTKTVLKVIRKDNYPSAQLSQLLKNKQIHENYFHTLKSASKLDLLGEHICEVINVYRDGGYESPYIKGENIQVLKEQMSEGEFFLTINQYEHLLFAIEKLYTNLDSYNTKYGNIPGDWMHYNLVYNMDLNKIMNVDVEGFYTWDANDIPNNIDRIREDLDGVKSLIHHKLSSPRYF